MKTNLCGGRTNGPVLPKGCAYVARIYLHLGDTSRGVPTRERPENGKNDSGWDWEIQEDGGERGGIRCETHRMVLCPLTAHGTFCMNLWGTREEGHPSKSHWTRASSFFTLAHPGRSTAVYASSMGSAGTMSGASPTQRSVVWSLWGLTSFFAPTHALRMWGPRSGCGPSGFTER